MNWFGFGASVIGSLVWPCLVALMWFSISKDQRADLLDRLRKIGPSGVELEEASQSLTAATGSPPVREAIRRASRGSAITESPVPGVRTGTEPKRPDDAGDDAVTRLTNTYDVPLLRQMDKTIDAAARWGWIKAGGKAEDFPHPVVGWGPNGARILFSKKGLNPGDTVIAPGLRQVDGVTYVVTNWQPGDDLGDSDV